MNKTQIIIDSVLACAIIALFVLHFCSSDSKEVEQDITAVAVDAEMPIAYVDLDSILTGYIFAQEANDQLMNDQEQATVRLREQERTLRNEIADFQRKIDNNAFLSLERAQSEQQRLQKKQQDLQELEAKLSQELMVKTQNLTNQLADTLDNFLKQYNADGRYKVIFTNNHRDNIIMADEAFNITPAVVNELNKRYTPATTSKKKK